MEKDPQPTDPLLPRHTPTPTQPASKSRSTRRQHLLRLLLAVCIYGSALLFIGHYFYSVYYGSHGDDLSVNTTAGSYEEGQFFLSVKTQRNLCPGEDDASVKSAAQSEYSGLKGDSKEEPSMSFFWLSEAQHNPENAPRVSSSHLMTKVVHFRLTHGGGAGTSGLMNPMSARSSGRFSESHKQVYSLLGLYTLYIHHH